MSDDEIDDEALAEAREAWKEKPALPYVYACNTSQVPANGSRGYVAIFEHDEVAIFLLNGSYFAISNICPHQSSPILAEGFINKELLTVTCPMHGWEYHIPSGRFIGGGGNIKTYDLKIINNEIWVEEPQPQTWAD